MNTKKVTSLILITKQLHLTYYKPNNYEDSKNIITYLYKNYKNNIIYSIMNQYTPMKKLKYEELNHKISDDVYDDVINFAYDLGIRNAFIQEGETQKKSFIPDFRNQEF